MSENTGALSLTGSSVISGSITGNGSSPEEFFKIYTHSDFLKYFEVVKNDDKPLKDVTLYIDCGEKESELIEDSKKMMKLLEKIGYQKNINLFTHIESGGKHTEEAWANRLHIPFKKLFPKKNDSSIYVG